MRVSSFGQYNHVQRSIQSIQQDMAKQQWKIATGKNFQRNSEEPIKAKNLLVINQSLNEVKQFEKNSDDALSILKTKEDTLLSAYNTLRYVNEEAIKASNSTYNEKDLITIGNAIDHSIDQLVSLANTKHLNRFIFSGEKILTKPIDFYGNNVIYNGNNKNMKIAISSYFDIEVSGDGGDLFVKAIEDLVNMREALFNNDLANVSVNMEENQKNMDKIIDEVASIGTRMNTIDLMKESFEERKLNLEIKRQNNEEIDFAQVMSEYSISQRAFQATIQSGSLMLQTNILDYLR